MIFDSSNEISMLTQNVKELKCEGKYNTRNAYSVKGCYISIESEGIMEQVLESIFKTLS